MSQTIKIKRTSTAGKAPTASNLTDGELALNIADGKLFYKDATGTVKSFSSSGDWNTLTNKPAVIAAGADASAARNVISAAINETAVNIAATNAINLNNGRLFVAKPTAAITYAISNVPAAPNATCIVLDLDNTSNVAVTWWANIKWPKGVAPTLKAGRNLLGFITNDGTNWVGLVLGEEIA